jgi:hypothetical protein
MENGELRMKKHALHFHSQFSILHTFAGEFIPCAVWFCALPVLWSSVPRGLKDLKDLKALKDSLSSLKAQNHAAQSIM